MSNKFENGLFIFRRDLRIIDNNGLNFLSELCNNIYTIFIFTPEQVGSANKYKSDNSVQFMIESLNDLADEIKHAGGNLTTFYGHNDKVVADFIKAFNISIVGFNLDITPYSRERDYQIINLCQPETSPEDYASILDSYTRKGYRVIAAGMKTLHKDIKDDDCFQKINDLSREYLESNLHFLGFIVMENKVKAATFNTI